MNRVTEILGVKYPIIQAPMGWIARSQLASAVSNAGGFGIIETSSGETENCKAEILAMSKLTDKPVCIIIGPEGDFSEAERAKILSFKGVQALKINDNILRSETAVISAISIINYVIN